MIHELELEQILVDEGFMAKPYKDTRGTWTFGHGLTYLTKNESKLVVGSQRLPHIEEHLQEAVPNYCVFPTEVKKVLLNMAYQMGVTGLLGFRLALQAAQEGDYMEMAWQMKDSEWFEQTPDRARRLIARIEALV